MYFVLLRVSTCNHLLVHDGNVRTYNEGKRIKNEVSYKQTTCAPKFTFIEISGVIQMVDVFLL